MNSRLVRSSILIVGALFAMALLWTYLMDSEAGPTYTYSNLLADAQAGKVETITQDGITLTVKMKGTAEPKTTVVRPWLNLHRGHPWRCCS